MAGLNIAFFGSSLVSAYWNGAATYYRGLIRALAARGHHVTFYEPDAWDRQKHRDLADPSWAEVVVYSGSDEAAAHAMLDRAARADVVVKASGVGVFDELLEREVARLRSDRTTTVFWDVDAPATLERVFGDAHDPFRALIPTYDLVLTYGGGKPVTEAYLGLGARVCMPIYNALDPEEHFPVPREERFGCDLAFLGNRLPDREARVMELFFRTAALRPKKRFLLGGSGWEADATKGNVRLLGHVYTKDHNALNSTASAVLNITRESMVRFGWSPATRVFEAAGAAACLVTDAWLGIEWFLEPDREVLVARSAEDVAAHLDALTPGRAKAIGEAARRRILAEHTYAHRARQVEEVLRHG